MPCPTPHLVCGCLALLCLAASVGANFTLDSKGYFRNGTRLFVPVGVNYWPRSTGCNLWDYPGAFPRDEIDRDFGVLVRSGFNTVRLFATWPVFEPARGQFNETAWANFDIVLSLAASHGLALTVSNFVGGMSGRLYWPTWVKGNIYTDPAEIEATTRWSNRLGRALLPYSSRLVAMDLGSETNNIDTSPDPQPPQKGNHSITPADVVAWSWGIYKALREGCACTVPIAPGTGDGSFLRSGMWPMVAPESQRIAHDTLDTHTYPTLFEIVQADGLKDQLTHSATTFDQAFVRALGPVFMQEWGTLVTGGARAQDTYLRNTLPAAWAHGANGFIYWMMRDVATETGAATQLPYAAHGKESLLGLYKGSTGVLKDGLRFLSDFARQVTAATEPPPLPEDDPAAIGLYIPRHHYLEDPNNPGNAPSVTITDGTLALHMLRLGQKKPLRCVYGGADGGLPTAVVKLRTLVISGAVLDSQELLHLRAWVEAGGQLLIQGVAEGLFRSNAAVAGALLGATAHGKVAAANLSVAFPSRHSPVRNLRTAWRPAATWPPLPDGWVPPAMPALRNKTDGTGFGRVWTDVDGSDAVVALRNRLGAGTILAVVAPVAASIDPAAPAAVRDVWTQWFSNALDCLASEQLCDHPSSPDEDPAVTLLPASPPASQWPARSSGGPPGKDLVAPLPGTVGVYNGGGGDASAVTAAVEALKEAGVTATVLGSPLNSSAALAAVDAVLLPSQRSVDLNDQHLLVGAVNNGTCLLWHGYYPSAFSEYGNGLIGAAAVDFRRGTPTFAAFGGEWTAGPFRSGWKVFGEVSVEHAERPEWGTATVLATDSRGTPALLTNDVGHGRTVTVTGALELWHNRSALAAFYRRELALCQRGAQAVLPKLSRATQRSAATLPFTSSSP